MTDVEIEPKPPRRILVARKPEGRVELVEVPRRQARDSYVKVRFGIDSEDLRDHSPSK